MVHGIASSTANSIDQKIESTLKNEAVAADVFEQCKREALKFGQETLGFDTLVPRRRVSVLYCQCMVEGIGNSARQGIR
eukprot:11220940-Lingulodinium_polyedra.AAC.1